MKKLVLIATAFVILQTGCNPHDTPHALPQNRVDPFSGIIPYDTVGTAGVFITRSTIVGGYSNFYCWLNSLIGAPKSGRSIVQFNDYTMYFDGVSGQYMPQFMADAYSYSLIANTWNIKDSSAFSFSYNDTGMQPFVHMSLPDTIKNAAACKLYIDSISNADSVFVEVYLSGDPVYFPARAAKDSVNISTATSTYPSGSQPLIQVYAYRHKYFTINGFTYLFIKRYETQPEYHRLL